MKQTVAILVLVVLVVMAAAGCGAASSIAGLWYEETGVAGTIDFKSDGTCEMEAMGFKISGTYTFEDTKSEGQITIDFMGEKTTSPFTVKDGKLSIDGSIYTRNKVEQANLSELFGDLNFGELME